MATEDIIVANTALQIAVRDDDLKSRVDDLRNLTLVSKSWKAAMDKHATLVIAALISTLRCSYSFSKDVCAVIAAVELGTAASREWLEKEYKDEEKYIQLLEELVNDPEGVIYICPLQYVNDTFGRIINNQTYKLISQLHFPLKFYTTELIPSTDFIPLLLGTSDAMKVCKPEIAWDLLGCTSIADHNKARLLRRLITKNPEIINRRSGGRDHLFWYWAIEQRFSIKILKEIFKYPNKLENQITWIKPSLRGEVGLKDGEGVTPLQKAVSEERHYLVLELLKRPDSTGNEIVLADFPVILWALYEKKQDVVKCLIAKPTCDINVQNIIKMTPIKIALRDAEFDIVELLLQRPDINLIKKGIAGTTYDLAQRVITQKLVPEEALPRLKELAAKIKEMEREQRQRERKHGGCCIIQ